MAHVRNVFAHPTLQVLVDMGSILAGENWERALKELIKNSDWVLVLVTRNALRSTLPLMEKEVNYAQSLGKSIIPCISEEIGYADLKWGLDKIQGLRFDNGPDLAKKLIYEIKKRA